MVLEPPRTEAAGGLDRHLSSSCGLGPSRVASPCGLVGLPHSMAVRGGGGGRGSDPFMESEGSLHFVI